MKAEREAPLGAGLYERSEQRRGRAHGHEPKTVSTRLGRITFDIPLDEMVYLYLDARYEKVRINGQVRDAAMLIAAGVDWTGKRSILGISTPPTGPPPKTGCAARLRNINPRLLRWPAGWKRSSPKA